MALNCLEVSSSILKLDKALLLVSSISTLSKETVGVGGVIELIVTLTVSRSDLPS